MDYKDLGLNDKYKETKKSLKKAGNKIKSFKWLKKLIIIAGIIIGAYILNIALGNAFVHSYTIDKTKVDFMPEGKEISIVLDNNADPDTDGIITKEELSLGTNPFNRDTDGDGVTDDGEINLGLDPLVYNENILEDAYNGIIKTKYDIPVNYEGFELRASNLHSRAYMSIISEKLPNESVKTTIRNFIGEVNTNAYMRQSDGLHRQSKKVDGTAEFISEDETITTLRVFGNDTIIENGFLRGLLNFILPQSGAICAFDNLKSDYTPVGLKYNNKFSDSNMEYANNVMSNLGESRFNLLHIDTSFKDKLSDRVRLGEIVPASIISDNKEYLILITGQFEDGNFSVSDAETKKEIGTLYLEKTARPITDGENFVQMESLSFTLGDLSSEKGDRLVFL